MVFKKGSSMKLLACFVMLFSLFCFSSKRAVGQCSITISLGNNSNDTICQGQSVTLQATANGVSGNNYSWTASPGGNLSNGSSINVSPNQTTTYIVSGNCQGGGNNTVTDTIVITVLQAPTVSISNGNPNTVCPGTSVSLTANTSSLNTISWSNGQTSPTINVTPFNTTNYTVTVINTQGCTASAVATVNTFQYPDGSVNDFNSNIPFTNCGSTLFTLEITNTSTSTNIDVSTLIQWGDGNSTNLNQWPQNGTASHTYNSLGYFTLTVTTTSTNGCVRVRTYTVYNGSNPSVPFSNPGSSIGFCTPFSFSIPTTINNNPPGTIYIIQYNDGSPNDTLQNSPWPSSFTHVFNNTSCGASGGTTPNTFFVKIRAQNPCGFSDLTIEPITTNTKPVSNFTISPDTVVCVNTQVTFTNTGTAAVTVNNNGVCDSSTTKRHWTINPPTGWGPPSGTNNVLPGGTQLGQNPPNNNPANWGSNALNVTFSTAGTYTISLTMDDKDTCGTDVRTRNVCIETPPSPSFTMVPDSGCAPFSITPINTTTNLYSCRPLQYAWSISSYSAAYCGNTSSWSLIAGGANSFEPTFQFINSGIYVVRLAVTNSCGTFFAFDTIRVKTKPIVNLANITSPCGPSPITPVYSATNCGVNPLTYSWTFSGGTPSTSTIANPGVINFNNIGSANITLQASNECGPTSASVSFNVNPLPNINAGPDQTICFGAVVQLNGSSSTTGATFSWSPATGLSATNIATPIANPSTTTTYTLTVTSPNGCTATDQVLVSVNPTPIPQIPPASTCSGQPVTITATGGISYLWNTGATTASITISPTVNTVYTVTATNTFGCTASTSATVTAISLPVVNAGPDITLCDQPVPFTLTVYSPLGGTWSGTNVTSGGVFTPNGTGTFTLTYTYTNPTTTCTNSDVMVVTVVNPQVADAGTGFSICQSAPSVTLTGYSPISGGTWSGTNVTAGGIFTPSTVGTFVLTYSFGTGTCLSTDTIQVTVNSLPQVTATGSTSCSGAPASVSATVAGTGTNTYLWNTGATTSSINPSPTTTTTYTVTVTNAVGCTSTATATANVNPLPVVDAGNNVTLCNQAIPYTLTGYSPLGGTWSGTNVTSGGVFTPNGVGTFTLTYTYTDPLTGCINSDDLVVTVSSPQLAYAGTDFSICQNAPSIQLAGFSPIGGSWSGSPWVTNSGVFTPSVVGTFTLTYSYGSGTCLSTDDLVVNVNPRPSPSVNNAVICLNQPAILTVNGGLSYLWSTGDIATSITVSPSITTTYTVTATNLFGCTASDSGTVTVNLLPVVDAGNDTTYCFQGINVQLPSYATPANGTWFGSGVLSASGLFDPSIPGIGSHYVYYTFTDANNCADYDSILVNIVLPSVAEAGPGNVVCIDNGVFSLGGFLPPTGGSWSGPGIVNAATGLFDPSISGVGTFLLYYEFGVGSCYTKDSATVIVNPLPLVNAGSDIDTCISVAPFSLTGFSPLSGGSWSGSGVTSSGLFSPTLAGAGSHTLVYEYQEPSTSCVNRDSITVLINPLPVPGFIVDSVLCLNSPFTITNNTTGATSYLWNFGDGNNSSLFNPTHTYIQTGTYTISLIATSASGCVDSISFNVQVVVPPTVAFSLSTDDGCGPLLVDITNNSVSFNPSYLWDFGNGTTGTMIDPLPISYPAGVIGDTTYYITLSTTNLCGSAIVVDSILVRPSPTASFGIDFNTGCSPLTVNFANVSYGLPTTFFWDFGDGTTSTDSLPLPHTYFAYTNDTTYYITLIVTNPCGSDTLVDSVTVSPNTVNAFINATPQSGCQPLTVTFTNFSTGGSNYYWDFGDGNTSIGYSVTHTYQNPGTYTASFQIDNGCSFDTVYRNIMVYPKPVVDFIAVPDTVCIGDIVQFTNSSTQALTATLWNFGDGSTSTLAQPQHAYAAPGTYNVTLIGIASQSCSDTVIKTVVVRTPPLVSAGFDTVYCNSNTIVNLSTPSPSGGIWLGNGILNPNTGTFNPSFVGVGTFQVFYSYTDVFGCSNSDTALVTVNLPDTVLVGSDTSVCINSNPFLLNGLPVGGSWSGTLVQPNGLVTPSTDGNYTLTYTYGVGSCLVRDSLILTVNPLPVLSVSGNPTSLCVNDSPVSLLATPLGGVWNGPGLTGNVFDPSVTGAAQVNLVYTFADNNGCVNSASLPIAVNGLPVVTIANDTSYCLQPIPAQLPFASPPGGIWSGTGVTSQTLGTFFPPNSGLGVHQIYYSYTDGNNCTNVDTILVTINPPANVDAGPDTAVCYNTAAFVLVGSPLGGTWSGPFVQPGGNFVPSTVGTHQLIYTFGQGTCERKDTLYVTVHPLPPINLAGNIVTHCVNDPAVSLLASPLGGIWSGPGVVGTFFNPSIAGIGSPFVLSYSFVDSNSCVNTALLNMSVLPLPSVNAGNDTTVCDQNIAVSLFGNYGNAGTWTGAGVTANGIFNPQGIGTYPLVYTYTDPNGCTDSDTMVVTVIPPTFAEAGPGLTLCVDAGNVTMPSFSPGTGGIWYYPFGPGVVDAAAGIINPSLLMQGSTVQTSFVLYYQYGFGNCLTTDSTIVVVNPLPIVNAGADTSSCITASPFNLFGFTPNGGVWSGIGVVDSLAGLFDPWLANAGTYQITYTYTDPTTGCQNSDYRDITVHPQPVADYDSSLFEGCQPLPVNFINQTTGATGYVWDFGDGNVSTLSNPLHIYADSGQFNVILYTESSFGCRDTVYGTVVVHPKPVADFTYTPAFSCVSPVNVQMQNLSTDPTGSLWDFGAQGTSTFIDPSITYAQPGSYPIQLISTSAFGCKDTMVKNYEVYPTPEAIPLIADPTACVGEPVPFTHASLNGVYYQWQFGDGDSTDIASPIHIYSAPGVYSIQLVVVGAGGCSDTAIVQNAISVLNTPVASFNYIKDPDPYNYGLVNFSNYSTGGTSYNWDFGDGTSSPLINPSHQYQNYGEYVVTLIVTNANGCADTAVQIIYVDYFKGLFVPNALTPEDGPEDVRNFLPKGRGLKKYRLEIFDGWGNLLWYSEKLVNGIPTEGWLGTRMDEGVLLPQDVYIWKIRAEFLDGSLWEGQDRGDGRKRNTGTITLIR